MIKGSFTVEIALIFPVVFLIVLTLLQCGLFFTYHVYSRCLAEQSVMLCIDQRKEGVEAEEAVQVAQAYLGEKLRRLPLQVETCSVVQENSFLQETYTATMEAKARMLISFTCQWTVKQTWMEPVLFRNRVDYLWEKGQQYGGEES